MALIDLLKHNDGHVLGEDVQGETNILHHKIIQKYESSSAKIGVLNKLQVT